MSLSSTTPAPFKNSVTSRLRLTRIQRGLLFGAIALIAFLPIVYLGITPIPFERDVNEGAASLHLTTSNMRMVFPNQCADVTWNVEGVKTIAINGQGKVGQGSEKICDTSRSLTMNVELPDGTNKELRIGLENLFLLNPVIALLLITGVVMLTLALHNLLGSWVAITVLTVALMLPVFLFYVTSGGAKDGASDYSGHIRIAQGIMDGSRTIPPHFLYHAAVIGWVQLFPDATLQDATLFFMLAASILTSIGMYAIIRIMTGKRPDTNWKWTLIYLAVPLLAFIGPVDFRSPMWLTSARIYPNPVHSPTYIFLKPFAVGLFACFAALYKSAPKRWLLVGGMALLTILGALAKPAYTLPIVPAAGLLFLFTFVRSFPIKRWELIAGILLPAVVVLGWQYLYTYGPQQGNLYGQTASLQFAPLVLFLEGWKVPPVNLITDFMISLAFPIFVYLGYRRAWRDGFLNMAWLVFLAGQSLGYLFIEMPNWGHGNMVWSGRITSLVLFAASTAFFLRENRDLLANDKGFPRDARFYVGMLLLALHIIPILKLLL